MGDTPDHSTTLFHGHAIVTLACGKAVPAVIRDVKISIGAGFAVSAATTAMTTTTTRMDVDTMSPERLLMLSKPQLPLWWKNEFRRQ